MFFDEEKDLTKKAALRALVIGVSHYPNLLQPDAKPPPRYESDPYTWGLFQLESAALSAYAVARWLVDHRGDLAVPLASVRLLLSPSARELRLGGPEFAAAAANAPTPTLANLSVEAGAWRDASNSHADGMTMLYLSGHGIQRKNGDRVLLLHEFGEQKPKQWTTVACDHLLSGMWPTQSRQHMALRQLAFFDACQHQPEELKGYEQFSPGEVWDLTKEEPKDPRNRLVFYATKPGALAYGTAGSKSYLCEALLACLNGGAAEMDSAWSHGSPWWRVTSSSLNAFFQPHLDVINAREAKSQIAECHRVGDYEICKFRDPPDAEIELRINPLGAVKCTSVTVAWQQKTVLQVGPPLDPHPHRKLIPAGMYILSANATSPFGSCEEIIHVKPPVFTKPLTLSA